MKTRPVRTGFTLMELLVVLAVLILLAVIVIPSTDALYGDTRSKAAADQIRGELAAARAWAIEDGQPYRVAVSDDGTKIRRAPEADFTDSGVVSESTAGARRVEYAFEKVKAEVQTGTEGQPAASDGGWVTIAVMLPDGTCRTDRGTNPIFTVGLKEAGQDKVGLQVTVRALTGETRITKAGGKS